MLPMRNALNGFYRFGGALSALQLVAIMVMVVLQVLGRVLDRVLVWLGADALGLNIPGLAEIAAFFLLGATFFGLAYTSAAPCSAVCGYCHGVGCGCDHGICRLE